MSKLSGTRWILLLILTVYCDVDIYGQMCMMLECEIFQQKPEMGKSDKCIKTSAKQPFPLNWFHQKPVLKLQKLWHWSILALD